MTLDDNGLRFLAFGNPSLKYWGERKDNKAYFDRNAKPSPLWTIGIGFTWRADGTRVREGDYLTDEQIMSHPLFNKFEAEIAKMPFISTLNQQQYNAVFSICWNTGVGYFVGSPLRKMIEKNPNDPNIKFVWHNSRTNKGLTGLVNRRKAEFDYYWNGETPQLAATQKPTSVLSRNFSAVNFLPEAVSTFIEPEKKILLDEEGEPILDENGEPIFVKSYEQYYVLGALFLVVALVLYFIFKQTKTK